MCPHSMASRTSFQAAGLRGGIKRFLPEVFAPYGTPRKTWIPPSVRPRSFPKVVSATGAEGADRAAVQANGTASAARAPAINSGLSFKNLRREDSTGNSSKDARREAIRLPIPSSRFEAEAARWWHHKNGNVDR